MNRYMMGIAMALLLVASDSLAAQTRARVEYRNGRIDVGVALGRLPVRVSPHGPTARGWVAADWGPVRIRVASRPTIRYQGALNEKDLRHILGKETVKDIERHAKRMGIKGKTRGQWFQADRNTTVLEVTVDRIPVAEIYDYRNDGYLDEIFLTGPPNRVGYGDWNRGQQRDPRDGRYDNWERWDR
jgi:hypothetical protein